MMTPRRRRALVALAAGAAILVVAIAAAVIAAHLWVGGADDFVYPRAEVPARPVVIVPGARVYPSGAPSMVLADRLECALDLYRAGAARRVLVSGDHGQAAYDETNAMRRYLVARGVADGDVFMDHAGFRTLDTMERARAVFGVRAAVVCTQAFHARRSVFLARRAGIDAVGAIADRHEYPGSSFDRLREVLAVTRAALDALIGIEPRHAGPPIPIDGDAARTHDRWTR